MKKFCISILIFTIIILSVVCINFQSNLTTTEYLRIHIRANSNQEVDQNVKYKVKDAVVLYLTPGLANCNTKLKAKTFLQNNLNGLERVANNTLKNSGYNYTSKAKLTNEEFPTRVYGEFVLEGGYYDALIIYLGDGEGDNWWCVVYPPLCFVGGNGNFEIRSKIIDLINDFRKRFN